MCRIRVHYHIYLQCQFADSDHAPGDESGREQPGADDVPRTEPVRTHDQGQPASQRSVFSFSIPFANRLIGNRDESHEATQLPAETGADESSQRHPHKIKETTIFQCPEARGNNALGEQLDKRHCPIEEMEPILGYNPDGELDHTFTPNYVPCPVCKAIDDAAVAALEPKLVVGL